MAEIENGRDRSNWATPVAKNTVASGCVGAICGAAYGHLWNVRPIRGAVASCALQAFVFSGVFFTCRSAYCGHRVRDIECAPVQAYASSGAITGGIYAALRKGMLRSPVGVLLGGCLGSCFFLTKLRFEGWRERERTRLLSKMQTEDGRGFENVRVSIDDDEHSSSDLWDRLTRLPRWFPIRFLNEEEAHEAEERARRKIRDRLADAYEGFEGPMFDQKVDDVATDADGVTVDDSRSLPPSRRGPVVRMHNPGRQRARAVGRDD